MLRSGWHHFSWRWLARLLIVASWSGWHGVPQLSAAEFPEVYNSERDQTATPMEPEEAARAFVVPAGVTASLFAAEPEIQNPIAMTWDSRGRLWIAENYTYAERSLRFDLSLRDRIVILSDHSGGGRPDRRQVFTDQVQMLTGLEVGHGGVWLMCPPQLLFIPDAGLDGTPDGPAQVVLDGFDVAPDNYHNFANGLRWGPDGWLYGRCGGSCPGKVGPPGCPAESRIPLEGGIWRYHVQTGRFEVLAHGTTNPWGHDWDAWGECFFINTVNGHLWHLIPGAHYDRPFTLDPNPHVYELLGMHADHWHFDTGKEWFHSRNGTANELGGGHAHVGMMIYLADNWPQSFHGKLFTWNIHGRRANQERLERHGSGYLARHEPDMLLASDPFFRGMELGVGPEGAVYAIDWSDTGECHEHTGVHRTSGRVFRFAAGSPPRQPQVDLRQLSGQQLAELHAHPNQWHVRQARLILAEHAGRPEAAESVTAVTQAQQWLMRQLSGGDACLALNSLCTLYCMGAISPDDLLPLLNHPHEHLRVWAVRLLLDQHPIDDIFGRCADRRPLDEPWLARLIELAGKEDSGLVRLALASSLQRLPLESRLPLAAALISRTEDAEDHNLPLIVWYGLMPVAEALPVETAQLALGSTWPKTQYLIARRLAGLIEECPAAIDRLIGGCIELSPRARLNVLGGLAAGLKGWRSAPQPARWQELLARLESSEDGPSEDIDRQAKLVQELGMLFGDGRTAESVMVMVLDPEQEISLRRAALEALVRSDAENLIDICLPLLADSRINAIAARGLAHSSAPEIADELIKHYGRFRSPQRPEVIALLISRPTFAARLLEAIAQGTIPASDLTAYDVRQIRAYGDEQLNQQIAQVWGVVRESDADKRQLMGQLRERLSGAGAADGDAAQGRRLFEQRCAQCHRLFGSGQATGPDLTGANRGDLDYLIENIVDPSGVVSQNYRLSLVQLEDGRVLSGLILSQDAKTLELQTQHERLTLAVSEIAQIQPTALSPMPDGLLDNLTKRQVVDLFTYLRRPTQVPLPVE